LFEPKKYRETTQKYREKLKNLQTAKPAKFIPLILAKNISLSSALLS